MRLFLIVACFVAQVSAGRAEDKEAEAEIAAAFRGRGMSKEAAAKLAPAFVRADELQSATPLYPFMEDQDLIVAMTSAAVAIQIAPKTGTARVMKLLNEKRGAPPALLLALSASGRRETVQFLISELAARRGEEREEAAAMALRVLTQQTWVTPAEWVAWWKNRGSKLKKLPFAKDEIEWEQRATAAISLLRSDRLKTSLASNPKLNSNDATTRGLEKILSDQLGLLEKGGRMQLSAAAKEGDAAMVTGNFDKAARAYQRAAKTDTLDRRSAYLRACCLFELGRRPEAKKVFAALAAADPKAVGAEFMARLCDTPQSASLLQASREILQSTVLFKGESPGWDDPILGDLFAQWMAGSGPHSVPQTSMDAVTAVATDDVELRCGAAQSRPRVTAANAFAALREQFPESPLPIAGWLEASTSGGKKVTPEMIEAARYWRQLEGDNAVPLLLELSLQNPRDRKAPSDSQPLDRSATEAIIAAIQLPQFDTKRSAMIQSVRRTFEEIDFPFPLGETTNLPSFTDPMSNLFWRLGASAQTSFEEGDLTQVARTDAAIDLLAERLLAAGGSDLARVMYTSLATITLKARRSRLIATGATADTLAKLEGRILAFSSAALGTIKPKEVTLQMLFLPSLEREIVNERIGDPYVDVPATEDLANSAPRSE